MRRYPAAPHPFILSPEFSLRKTPAGKQINIGLTLAGKANQYLPYVVETFRRMGEQDIGSSKSRFKLIHLKQQIDSAQDSCQILEEQTLSTGYIYGLLNLVDMREAIEGGKPENAIWRSYFSYRTYRMLERQRSLRI